MQNEKSNSITITGNAQAQVVPNGDAPVLIHIESGSNSYDNSTNDSGREKRDSFAVRCNDNFPGNSGEKKENSNSPNEKSTKSETKKKSVNASPSGSAGSSRRTSQNSQTSLGIVSSARRQEFQLRQEALVGAAAAVATRSTTRPAIATGNVDGSGRRSAADGNLGSVVAASLTPIYRVVSVSSNRRASCSAAMSVYSPTSTSLSPYNTMRQSSQSSRSPLLSPTSTARNSTVNGDDAAPQAYSGARVGRMRVAMQYSHQKQVLILTIKQISLEESQSPSIELNENNENNNNNGTLENGLTKFSILRELSCQVRMAQLTAKGTKAIKYRTKFRTGIATTTYTNTTIFNDTFAFTIPADEVDESAVRLRVYARGRAISALVGETILRAALVNHRGGISTVHELILHVPPTVQLNNFSGSYLMSLFPPLLSRSTSPTLQFHSPNNGNNNNNNSNNSNISNGTAGNGNNGIGFVALGSSPAAQSSTVGGSAPNVGQPTQPHQLQLFLFPTNGIQGSGGRGTGSLANSTASTPGGSYGPGPSTSRRNSTVDDCGRFCSLPQANGTPELLISLCYIDSQSKIVVAVEKATGFEVFGATSSSPSNQALNTAIPSTGLSSGSSKMPDTFLRLSVLMPDANSIGNTTSSNSGSTPDYVELAKHKSEIVKGGTISPGEPVLYDETAVFQVASQDLERIAILIQVFAYGGLLRRRVALGWVCVGAGQSDPAACQHWREMIHGTGTTVDKWHHIVRTPFQLNQ